MLKLVRARFRVLVVLGCSSVASITLGCGFDASPSPVTGNERKATTKWTPPSPSTVRTGRADAGHPTASEPTTLDSGARAHSADAGHLTMDAGKPMQQPEPDSLDAGDTNDVPPPLDVPSAMDSGQPMDSSVASTMTPSMSMSCQPGLYEGTFEGPITFAVGTINSVKGTLRAELVLGALANTLLVSSGTISGEDDTGVGMTARWTGRLNCETKQLENARHENGIWDNGTTFMGTLEGRYSADPYALDGTWQVRSEQIPLAAGSGTWHMDLQQSPFGEN